MEKKKKNNAEVWLINTSKSQGRAKPVVGYSRTGDLSPGSNSKRTFKTYREAKVFAHGKAREYGLKEIVTTKGMAKVKKLKLKKR